MKLRALAGTFSILRFPPTACVPAWAFAGTFAAVTKTAEELSIVCEAGVVEPGYEKREDDWRCLEVAGPLDFALTGILSALAAPLAVAGISIFAVSTFDTDYLLVKAAAFDEACATLRAAGFTF